MVDVGKMVSDGDESKYVTPKRWPCWACIMIGMVIGGAIVWWLQ